MRLWSAIACVSALLAAGCGSDSQSTPTSPTILNLTGKWSGNLSDSSGPGTATFTLTQSGSAISGSMAGRDTNTGLSVNGSLAGTLNGSALTFTITVPVGGYPGPFSVCSSTSNGSATVTATQINGTYSGSATGPAGCARSFTGGTVNLTKQ